MSSQLPAKEVLNYDVLRHIASLMAPDELARIKSANSVFFSEHMRTTYTEIQLHKRDKDMKKLLAHLSDRHVAGWVRRVRISPWLVQPRTKSPRSRTENLVVFLSRAIDPHFTEKVAQERLAKRLSKDGDRVTEAFGRMSNVEEYDITWDGNEQYHPELYQAYLSPILRLWSNQLKKLTLKIPPAFLDSLAGVRLPNLHSICFTFSTGSLTADEIRIAHTGFVVFINNLDRSLRSLSLVSANSSENLDLSHFFHQLGTFPQLQNLSISIPFDGGQLADPMTLVLFLEKHRRDLRELNLYTSVLSRRREGSHPPQLEWIQFILEAFQQPFPHLRSLGVALRPLRHPLNTLVRFLDMHTALKSLKLLDRSLTSHELESLFRTPGAGPLLASSLDTLYMKVDSLDPRILNSITQLLPNLESLSIESNMVSSRRDTPDPWGKRVSRLSDHSSASSSDIMLRSLSLAMPNFNSVQHLQPYLQQHFPQIKPNHLQACSLPHGQFIY
ncbi:hypothetical protein CPB83DRAFT_809056 [Crepidotus variabilis]|uniref:Uncharacterized protein n=1 Tax=Crepidotus variabilis TaxID=179855 RepID=A0A9P6ELM5_9AGAR|nr:hypothetical protein CPB83DRAFT_809056 [Crepidotus variabilis]